MGHLHLGITHCREVENRFHLPGLSNALSPTGQRLSSSHWLITLHWWICITVLSSQLLGSQTPYHLPHLWAWTCQKNQRVGLRSSHTRGRMEPCKSRSIALKGLAQLAMLKELRARMAEGSSASKWPEPRGGWSWAIHRSVLTEISSSEIWLLITSLHAKW